MSKLSQQLLQNLPEGERVILSYGHGRLLVRRERLVDSQIISKQLVISARLAATRLYMIENLLADALERTALEVRGWTPPQEERTDGEDNTYGSDQGDGVR